MFQKVIFVSAVTVEFLDLRRALNVYLTRPSVAVKTQEEFIDVGVTLLLKLDEYLNECDAVVHLIGGHTGYPISANDLKDYLTKHPELFEVEFINDIVTGQVVCSYTQWEAYMAIIRRKKLNCYLLEGASPVTGNNCQTQDEHVQRLKARGYYPTPFEVIENTKDSQKYSVLTSRLGNSELFGNRASDVMIWSASSGSFQKNRFYKGGNLTFYGCANIDITDNTFENPVTAGEAIHIQSSTNNITLQCNAFKFLPTNNFQGIGVKLGQYFSLVNTQIGSTSSGGANSWPLVSGTPPTLPTNWTSIIYDDWTRVGLPANPEDYKYNRSTNEFLGGYINVRRVDVGAAAGAGCNNPNIVYPFRIGVTSNSEIQITQDSAILFPNPFTAELMYDLKASYYEGVEILNQLGQKVLYTTIVEKHSAIDTKDLLPGIYFVRFVSPSKPSLVYKVVKQ